MATGTLRGEQARARNLELIARPVKIRRYLIPIAAGLLAAMTVAGVWMRRADTGATFDHTDQVAMVLIGVVLAIAMLLPLWPRVRADERGVEVRNVFNGRTFDWADVRAVSFPNGSPWARVELPADEYYPMMAIQAHDGQRAVDAMRRLRELHRASRPGD